MLKISIRAGRHRLPQGCEAKELSNNSQTNSVQTKNAPATRFNGYATCEDFRRVFHDNLDSLYQLCFLLTGDLDKAEQCLIASLDSCVRSHQVFRDWALPWAKRTLIQNAVRVLQLRPTLAESSWPVSGFSQTNMLSTQDSCFTTAAILSLQDFERFVFVLSVLDRYSDRDCAFLLRCLVEDIRKAKTRALERLAAWRATYAVEPKATSNQSVAHHS
jgi:DNA-directed RNA polymerase specialized sigma24 family protein